MGTQFGLKAVQLMAEGKFGSMVSRDKINVMPLQNKTLAIKPANMDAENHCIRDGVVVVTKGAVIPNETSI